MAILTQENEVLIRNMSPEDFAHYADLERPGDFILQRAVDAMEESNQIALDLETQLDGSEEEVNEAEKRAEDAESDASRLETENEELQQRIRDLADESDGLISKDRLLQALEVAA